MKNFTLLLFFVLFLAFSVSAQTNEGVACPNIEIRGGGFAGPGEITYFTVDVDTKGKDLKLEYIWSVKGGEIVEGQNKETIAVKESEDSYLTATVEIKGLPDGCPNTLSESRVVCRSYSRLFDEFSVPIEQIAKAKLDLFVNELQENPNEQGFIIEYFKLGTSQKAIRKKIQKITEYLLYEKQLEKIDLRF